jgi:hypothetical protein
MTWLTTILSLVLIAKLRDGQPLYTTENGDVCSATLPSISEPGFLHNKCVDLSDLAGGPPRDANLALHISHLLALVTLSVRAANPCLPGVIGWNLCSIDCNRLELIR